MMKNILIHGLGQNSESWDNTSMYLKENNIDIICPDLFEITKNTSKEKAISIKKFWEPS